MTIERTARVEAAEEFLHSLGLRECRVRYHEGDLARVEVSVGEIARLSSDPVRSELAREFRRLGFRFIALDLEGFRTGSLNELVPLELKVRYRAFMTEPLAISSNITIYQP